MVLSDGWRGSDRDVRRQVLITSVLAAAAMTYASDGPALRSFPAANAITPLLSGRQSTGRPVLRECARATASPYAKKDWHQRLGSGVHADAIMDHIVHNALWADTGSHSMREHTAAIG